MRALTPYRALFIDLDGVIRHWPVVEPSVEERFGLPRGSVAKIAFSPELLIPAITGVVTDAQWREGVAKQLARRCEGCAAAEAVAAWSAPLGQVDSGTLALLDRCRIELRIVLTTNATSRLCADLKALGLSGRFDAVINSSDIGAAKPAPAFYRAALERTGLGPRQVLCIDDSTDNVATAGRMGIAAHRFVEHRAMADFLERAGVLDPAVD